MEEAAANRPSPLGTGQPAADCREAGVCRKRALVRLVCPSSCGSCGHTLRLLAIGRVAKAGTLQVLVDRTTGQTFLQNSGAGAVTFSAYTIKSPNLTARFTPANWLSVTDNYDSDSLGPIKIDPDDPWFELTGSTVELSEAVATGLGGSLTEGQSLNLGNVFQTATPRDLLASYLEGSSTITASVFYRLNAADYNRDGLVNTADYNVWSNTFGSTIDPRADGNLNGVIDAGDYNVWRDIFVAPAAIAFAAATVPEPTGIALFATTIAAFIAQPQTPFSRDAVAVRVDRAACAVFNGWLTRRATSLRRNPLRNHPLHPAGDRIIGVIRHRHMRKRQHMRIGNPFEPPALDRHQPVPFAFDDFLEIGEALIKFVDPLIGNRSVSERPPHPLANPLDFFVRHAAAGAEQNGVLHVAIPRPGVECREER